MRYSVKFHMVYKQIRKKLLFMEKKECAAFQPSKVMSEVKKIMLDTKLRSNFISIGEDFK